MYGVRELWSMFDNVKTAIVYVKSPLRVRHLTKRSQLLKCQSSCNNYTHEIAEDDSRSM